MTPDELVRTYPLLFHMAESGSWPRIQQIGLRTTEQLVHACTDDRATREAILRRRRAHPVRLDHPVAGSITVRDQRPLLLHNLEPALTDVTVEQFLALLNDRVFLWTHPSRLEGLLGARAYRDSEHDVLVLDTASVVAFCADRIRLTGLNTGSTVFPNASPRGAESFLRIEDFPFAERRKRPADNVVELCVIGGIDQVQDHVVRVERRRGPEVVEFLHQR